MNPNFPANKADHAGGMLKPAEAKPDRWSLLAAEFAKPQFMTTTSHGGGSRKYTLQFTWIGDDAAERCHAMHDAIRLAAKERT